MGGQAALAKPIATPVAVSAFQTPESCVGPEPLRTQEQAGRWLSFLGAHHIRPKLAISAPDDPEEREADALADRVMRTGDSTPSPLTISRPSEMLSRACCSNCAKEDDDGKISRKAGDGAVVARQKVETAFDAIAGGGRPLGEAERSFFEPRFGHDFSAVRIHTDGPANRAASGIGALAYTDGSQIAFASGRYQFGTVSGRRLLAHELAHVVQHTAAPDKTNHSLKRKCKDDLGEPSPECKPSQAGVAGKQFLFDVNCDDLKSVEVAPGDFRSGEGAVAEYAKTIGSGVTVNVHGYASGEGPDDFNEKLSCHRANKVAGLLRSAGIAVIDVFQHGGKGNAPHSDFFRSVLVEEIRPKPPPSNRCGPDVTDWLIAQVAMAKQEKLVLEIKTNLAGAQRIAASNGFSAERVAEGGVAKKMLAAEAQAKPTSTAQFPKPTGDISASAAGQQQFARAVVAATAPLPFVGAPEQAVLLMIRRASIAWKSLVGTGQVYDFKSNVLKGLAEGDCPKDCSGSVTICREGGFGCVNADVPGNLFYAHVGRFVGFTELSLKLGSQFAQLDATARWDPPEDTAMITVGANMKDPLDRAELCRAMKALRNHISLRPCEPCMNATTISPVSLGGAK